MIRRDKNKPYTAADFFEKVRSSERLLDVAFLFRFLDFVFASLLLYLLFEIAIP